MHDEYAEMIINSETHGIFHVKIDLDDVKRCKKHIWHVQKIYDRDADVYYVSATVDRKKILLHRFVMKVRSSKKVVDHINGDNMDNRKKMLRVCTNSQNAKNRKTQENNKSGHRGVIWYHYNDVNKWLAYISVDKKRISLGYFDNYEDAVNARLSAEEEYYGEFRRYA